MTMVVWIWCTVNLIFLTKYTYSREPGGVVLIRLFMSLWYWINGWRYFIVLNGYVAIYKLTQLFIPRIFYGVNMGIVHLSEWTMQCLLWVHDFWRVQPMLISKILKCTGYVNKLQRLRWFSFGRHRFLFFGICIYNHSIFRIFQLVYDSCLLVFDQWIFGYNSDMQVYHPCIIHIFLSG